MVKKNAESAMVEIFSNLSINPWSIFLIFIMQDGADANHEYKQYNHILKAVILRNGSFFLFEHDIYEEKVNF